MAQNGNVRRYRKTKGYESISRDMLQDEENLSIEAIGLLSNLLSYSDDWNLYKTELYNRFKKSKRRKIQNAWNELVEEGYILQFRKRSGKSYEYIYYYQDERFTDEDIKIISASENAQLWDGTLNNTSENENTHHDRENWTVHNEQSKMDSPNLTPTRSMNYEVYDKHQDTYEDTKKHDTKTTSTKSNNAVQEDNSLKDSLKDSVPEKLHYILSVFAYDYDQMRNWIGVIFRAKNEVSTNHDFPIALEEYDETLANMFKSFARKYKTDSSIKNPDSYLFITIRNGLERTIALEKRQYKDDNDDIYYNWLEN